jgi:hypothetical protein
MVALKLEMRLSPFPRRPPGAACDEHDLTVRYARRIGCTPITTYQYHRLIKIHLTFGALLVLAIATSVIASTVEQGNGNC